MSLTAKIKTIINTLYPTATYFLASKFRANINSIDLTTAQLPLIILDNEVTKDAEIKKNNNVLKNTKLLIYILDADDIYNSDDETNTLIEACEAKGDRIAVNVYQLPQIIPTSNQRYRITPVFHAYNTNLSGVLIEMQVNDDNVVRFCATEPTQGFTYILPLTLS